MTNLGLPRRPIITYGLSPTVIALTYPQKLWDYESQYHGGALKFSSGVVESFVIREDNRTLATLRVHDCEYLEVRAWIIDAMLGNAFDFQFDSLDLTSLFTCYLDAPTIKDGFKPKRMANWPDIWEVDIILRSTAALPMYVSSSGACGTTDTIFGS